MPPLAVIVNGSSAIGADNTGHLPVAEDCRHRTVIHPRVALAERQIVDEALHIRVFAVEIGPRVVALEVEP